MKAAPGLVWDACALLNLMATGCAEMILPAFECQSHVVRDVRTAEVLYLRPLPEETGPKQLIAADVAALLASGLLMDVELLEDEQAAFVAFAYEMDDGEARSAAVAAHREFWLVTDDRVSLRAAAASTPVIVTRTTPDWVRFYAETSGLDDTALAALLKRIQVCASYFPRRVHPLCAWWEAALLRGEG